MTTVMPKYIHPTTQAVSKRDNMYTLVDYSKNITSHAIMNGLTKIHPTTT